MVVKFIYLVKLSTTSGGAPWRGSGHQVVVVTGASSGIGREVAVLLHREGAR